MFADEPVEFDVKFRQVADYPLDLYYLMDLTASMREDKEILESLGRQSRQQLQNSLCMAQT